MSDNAVQAPEENLADRMLEERLKAVRDIKKPVIKGRRPFGALLGGAAGLAAIAAVGFAFLPSGDEGSSLKSAEGDGFQTQEGSGFGDLPPAQPPATQVIEREVVVAPEKNDETQKLIDDLRAQVDALRKALENPVAAPEDPRIASLTDEMERLQAAEKDRRDEMERLRREKDMELQRLQSELDLARLNGGHTDGGQPLASDNRSRETSGMIVFGGNAGAGENGEEGKTAQEAAKLSSNEEFVRNAGKPAPVERASVIVNPANTITQGTMIQAVLETAINSTLPGAIRAVVSENVYSYDGSRTLIPRGSMVIGKYSESVILGQRRVLVAWERIILPDNQSVTIAAYGGDELGQSGVTGRVNSHFGTRFGSATLISLLAVLPAVASRNTTDESTQELADSVGQNLQSAAQSVVGEYLRIKPTIHIDQGSLVTIMVDRDLEIF